MVLQQQPTRTSCGPTQVEAAGGGEHAQAGLTPAQERMLDCIRKAAGPDGWADWDHVYPDWEPRNVPVQFGGRAAQLVWAALERRGLVEQRHPDMKVRVKP